MSPFTRWILSDITARAHDAKFVTINSRLPRPHQNVIDISLVHVGKSTVKSLNDVRSQVKSDYQSNSSMTDIDVTFDGTWLTRGHSSQLGVGCVIDLLTGFVMDFEIM
ncbi:uncharacterized protein TNCV_1821221 [Trichonephila clavipes]|nr:uncharacterized protein TNCV_1821221 [Trichonephila clavipes]